MDRRVVAVLAVIGTVGSISFAQDAAPAPAAPPAHVAPVAPTPPPGMVELALKPGMPAPEFKVEKFLKGEPFSSFEKGKVYVIEFWATWCGPCIMGIPHLTDLQKEYKDKGVVICGVNVAEDKVYTPETLTKVTNFVETTGDAMGYSVAYDGAVPFMQIAWMKAAGQRGIPCAFVVDQKGTVAWIGHPMQLDMVLEEVTAGKWDIEKGPERLKAAMDAFAGAMEKYNEGFATGSAAWDDAVKQYPAMAKSMGNAKFRAILQAKHIPEACVLGNAMVDKGIKEKAIGPISEVLDAFGDPATLAQAPAKHLMLRAAQASFDLSDPTKYATHVVMARALFFAGETEKARVSASKALELAPEQIRERLETWLKEIEEQAKQVN